MLMNELEVSGAESASISLELTMRISSGSTILKRRLPMCRPTHIRSCFRILPRSIARQFTLDSTCCSQVTTMAARSVCRENSDHPGFETPADDGRRRVDVSWHDGLYIGWRRLECRRSTAELPSRDHTAPSGPQGSVGSVPDAQHVKKPGNHEFANPERADTDQNVPNR